MGAINKLLLDRGTRQLAAQLGGIGENGGKRKTRRDEAPDGCAASAATLANGRPGLDRIGWRA